MQGPFDNVKVDTIDAFVCKLSVSGSALMYSTYLGGDKTDGANGIAVDDDECAYVIGSTSSMDFPRLNPYDNSLGGNMTLCHEDSCFGRCAAIQHIPRWRE